MNKYYLILIAGLLFSCKSRELDGTTDWTINDDPSNWELVIEDHVIALNKGFIEKKEVTVQQYREFLTVIKEVYGLDSAKYHLPITDELHFDVFDNEFESDLPWTYEKGKYNDMPATYISYENAISYCLWRGPYEIFQDFKKEGILKADLTYKQYVKKESFEPEPEINCCGCGEFRKVRIEDGLSLRRYRLPTKEQWEEAAFKNLDSSEYKIGKIKPKWYGKIDSAKLGLQLSDTNVVYENDAWEECGRSFPGNVTYNYSPNLVSKMGIHPNGCYGITGNVSEMTAVKGISKGGNVRMKLKDTDLRKDYKYSNPSSVLGFRCVMTYEKPTAWE